MLVCLSILVAYQVPRILLYTGRNGGYTGYSPKLAPRLHCYWSPVQRCCLEKPPAPDVTVAWRRLLLEQLSSLKCRQHLPNSASKET